MAHALKDMQKRYPLLALPSHGLYAIVQESLPRAPSGLEGNCVPVQECETAVCEGDEDKAKDILERLEHEVELEALVHLSAFRSDTPLRLHNPGVALLRPPRWRRPSTFSRSRERKPCPKQRHCARLLQ